MDKAHLGAISPTDISSIPELSMNPLLPRFIALFGANSPDGLITFRQFVETLSVFSPRTPLSLKIDFAFRLYDVKADGYISADELSSILKLLVGDHIPESQLDTIAAQTILAADTDGDARLSPEEFEAAMRHLPNFSADLLTIAF